MKSLEVLTALLNAIQEDQYGANWEALTAFTKVEDLLHYYERTLRDIAGIECESDVEDLSNDDALDNLNEAVGMARHALGMED